MPGKVLIYLLLKKIQSNLLKFLKPVLTPIMRKTDESLALCLYGAYQLEFRQATHSVCWPQKNIWLGVLCSSLGYFAGSWDPCKDYWLDERSLLWNHDVPGKHFWLLPCQFKDETGVSLSSHFSELAWRQSSWIKDITGHMLATRSPIFILLRCCTSHRIVGGPGAARGGKPLGLKVSLTKT